MSSLTDEYRHIPALLDEVLENANPKPGDVVVDCTLGGAGHSIEFAKRIGKEGFLIGIDQDDVALSAAEKRFQAEAPDSNHLFLKGNFSELDNLLLSAEIDGADIFLFDLGVSSPQLDIASRGFSYHADAPLDMRMDPRKQSLNAAEVINTYNEADLARILYTYGGEKHAKQIAKKIVAARKEGNVPKTTLQLSELVSSVYPARERALKHPAKKTFQALRIEVNGELDALERGLEAAIRWAKVGAVICVISYHSLEDRITSHIFAQAANPCTCPPDFPVCVCGRVPIVKASSKIIYPSEEEVKNNKRARSAKMRVAIKLAPKD